MRLIAAVLAAVAWLLATAAPARAGTTASITMHHYAFVTATLTVHVGDTVVWTNQDTAPHDVTTTSAPVDIHSPKLRKGESWQYTFTVAGSYSYICSVHPDMQGQVTVLPIAPLRVAHPPTVRIGATPLPAPTHRPTATATTPTLAPSTPTVAAGVTPSKPSLKPLLLLAGLISAVALFCLLLLASRPEPSSAPSPANGNERADKA